jgi:hypothetical protein
MAADRETVADGICGSRAALLIFRKGTPFVKVL